MIDPTTILNTLQFGMIFAKMNILDVIGLFLTLLIWGLAIFIMIHYNGDWNSFIWYLINIVVIGIGLMFFVIPGLILWAIWAKRAGLPVALLGGFLGVLGAAIGSSFGYESHGFLN
ncbi:hypothetical protein [Pyrococcus kukulkanii]|uniref:hypothetical protein n=1 Tax=Pyrococcus kukulkanii TaxID=1609559 RepID=UPI0035634137